jgi:hypothetical protein
VNDDQLPPLSREEAIAVMKAGLGEAELALVAPQQSTIATSLH